MLNKLRKGSASWIAKIFIGLLVLSFAVWGIADIFGGYGGSTVATVGDVEISAQEFQRTFQTEIRAFSARIQRQLSTEEARTMGLDARVLDQLITNASLDRHAADLNLGISDAAIVDAITKDEVFQDASGSFSRIAFEQILRSNGLTENGYLANRRQGTVRQQIANAFTRDISTPKALLEAAERFNKAKRTLRYFVLPASAVGKIEAPDETKFKAYYDSHQQDFTAPEYRKLALLVLSRETLKEKYKISDQELKEAYESAEDRYSTPERRQILQISYSEMADAQKAYESLKSGKSFTEVAKERGFSESDINLGLLSRDGLSDEKIRDAAFALKKDEFSKPVAGALSTVVLKVTKIEPEIVKKFEDVKSDIRDRLALEKAGNEALDLHDSVEDARAAGATLKEISEKLSVKFLEIEAVDRTGIAPGNKEIRGVPEFRTLLRAAFASDIGVENNVVEAGNGDFVWFDVVEVTASKLKPFDAVKTEAAEKWKESEFDTRMTKKSAEILKELRSGKSFKTVADSFRASLEITEPLTRTGSAEELTRSAVGQAFALPKDGFGSARAKTGNSRVIFQVTKIELPKKLEDKNAETLNKEMATQMARDLFDQYVTGLRRAYTVNVNQSTYNILTGREQAPTQPYGRRGRM